MFDSLRYASKVATKGQTRVKLPDGSVMTVKRMIPSFSDEALADAINTVGSVEYKKDGASNGKELTPKGTLSADAALHILESFLDEASEAKDSEASKSNGRVPVGSAS